MTTRSLRYQGSDVALVRRLPCGRVRICYVARGSFAIDVWPHDLIGNGWHLAAIKRAIAALTEPTPSTPAPRPRAFLPAHPAADHQRED